MNIEDIATEMKEKAVAQPFDPLKTMARIVAQSAGHADIVAKVSKGEIDPLEALDKMTAAAGDPLIDFHREFVFDGLELKVTLTIDLMVDKKMWHLSIGTQWGDAEISDDLCLKLLPIFLPLERRAIEVPSRHGPRCRQFLEPIEGIA